MLLDCFDVKMVEHLCRMIVPNVKMVEHL